jgi:hypothetical protein
MENSCSMTREERRKKRWISKHVFWMTMDESFYLAMDQAQKGRIAVVIPGDKDGLDGGNKRDVTLS